jgi:ribosomal protein L14
MKTSYFRSNGVWVRFNDNAVVLVNRRNAPYARR